MSAPAPKMGPVTDAELDFLTAGLDARGAMGFIDSELWDSLCAGVRYLDPETLDPHDVLAAYGAYAQIRALRAGVPLEKLL